MHPMLNIAIQAARSASKIIERSVDRLDMIRIDEKGRGDFVTQIDRYSEEEIIQVIRKSYPDHAILSEECGYLEGKEEFLWVIDPLDGTTNFIHGFPQFAISIALKRRGKLEIGLVYDPLRQELFTTARGEGAQLNHRKIRVSACAKMGNALIGTGFPFKQSDLLKPYLKTFETIFAETAGVRRAGSAALDLAYVAAGRLDGFWEFGLKEWDMAAGVLLIKEAGGFVSDFQGKEDYLTSGHLVAGNQKIHKTLLSMVQAT